MTPPRVIFASALAVLTFAGALAASVSACTEIASPAERPPWDGAVSDAPPAADASEGAAPFGAGCAGGRGTWRLSRAPAPLLAGDAPGTQLLVTFGNFEERAADGAARRFIYQLLLVGQADRFAGRLPVELAIAPNDDPETCAYCALASTDCEQVGPNAISCASEYRAVAGKARAVLVPTTDGGAYWVEIGELVLARVVEADGGGIALDRHDCIAIDRLVLEGHALEIPTSPCPDEYAAYCAIAATASRRGPPP